jgi:hypothetical protein
VKWSYNRRITFEEALLAIDPPIPELWSLSSESSYHGIHDRIHISNAPSFSYSLRLILVNDLSVRVSQEGLAFGSAKRTVRGYFTYSNNFYALAVTDPVMSAQYLSHPDSSYDIGTAILCVSLGEPSPHQPEYAYKLIAGIILRG